MEWQGYIPESRYDELKWKVAKLNKRAAKIGVAPITVELTGNSRRDEADFPYVCIMLEIIMKGETPKYEGWKLLAVLQHDPNLDANIVKTVPGETIPQDYRTRPGVCDHCGYKRIRKETFVVQHETDGEIKQVGRQCVADFLGHGDPRRFIKTWEWFEEASGWGMGFAGLRDEREAYSLEVYLAMTNAVIRKFGWVSGAKSRETMATSTATEVCTQLNPRDRADMRKYRPEDLVNYLPEDTEYAKQVIEWAKGISGNLSDYEHNIQVIANQEAVIRKTQGFAASMIMAYKRVHDVRVERKVSEYHGTVGDKVNLTLTFKATYSFEGYYGPVHMHRFVDTETGNIFIWPASRFTFFKEDALHTVKGTIKAHKDYKDIKQTILTRCKVEEVEENA